MPVRTLPQDLANYLQHSLPFRPAALELLFMQGRIIGRNHKRDLFGEIDRFKRACNGPDRRTMLQELWNCVQVPPHGTHTVKGKLCVLATSKPVRGFHFAFFVTDAVLDHTRGSGATPELAIAELARLHQFDPSELHIGCN
jgi:hypothetical protein